MGRIADETIRGAKWGLIQKCTMQPVQFLYGIVLARLITPEEFGILGLTSIFFAIAGQLQNCGFGSALIRKQDRTEEDCSTVFWYNVGASFVLSAALFVAAPWFADFFNQPPLVNITRVSAVMMFLGSTSGVHWALYSARRDFKTPAIVGMITTLVGIPVCLTLAFCGFSYWSMVIQGVVTGLLSLIIIWIISPWKPKFIWSSRSFKEFFGFGSKLVLSGLNDILYLQSRQLIIGKFYSPAQLGNFNKGMQLSEMPRILTDGVIGGVIFPILSTIQNDEKRLVAVYRKYIRLNNLVCQFVMLTMVFNAHALVTVLYGDAWSEASVYACILCIGAATNSLSSINANLYMVKGRTDIVLKINVLLRIFGIMALIGAAFISVVAMCWAAASTALVWFVLCLYYTTKVSSLDYLKQLKDYLPYIFFSIIANIPSYIFSSVCVHSGLKLMMGVGCSFVIYSFLLYLRRDEMANELIHVSLRSRFIRRITSKKLQWKSSK